jgi:ankyrin repeat protein
MGPRRGRFVAGVVVTCVLVVCTAALLPTAARAREHPALFDALANRDMEMVRSVVAATPNCVNQANHDGDTPLHIAAQLGDVAMAEYLLAHGARTGARDHTIWAPAGSSGRSGVEGLTPLHVAAQKGWVGVVRLLIRRHADVRAGNVLPDAPNTCPRPGVTPLYLASIYGHADVVELLLRAGADPAAKSPDGDTPLCIATNRGHRAVVALLLDAGADANARVASNGVVPLHEVRDAPTARLLLAHGARSDVKDIRGRTPLAAANEYGRKEVAAVLRASGARK